MNRLGIRNKLEGLIQGQGFDSDTLDSYINQCILYTGAQVEISALKRIDIVNTVPSQAYVALTGFTEDFSGKLKGVKSAKGTKMTVSSSLELLMDLYPTMNEAGDIEAVALEGSTLWYQKIPEVVETLTVLCYRDPNVLTADKDVPKNFPVHLHEQLFVHGTAWLILNQIDGSKASTEDQFWLSFSEDNKHSGIVKLREWITKTERHNTLGSWRE